MIGLAVNEFRSRYPQNTKSETEFSYHNQPVDFKQIEEVAVEEEEAEDEEWVLTAGNPAGGADCLQP